MQKINKITAQIKALNKRITEGKVKNVYAVQNKIKTLKNRLKIEIDLYNWENYLSFVTINIAISFASSNVSASTLNFSLFHIITLSSM